jgi:hypothetical protein
MNFDPYYGPVTGVLMEHTQIYKFLRRRILWKSFRTFTVPPAVEWFFCFGICVDRGAASCE